MNKRIEYIDIAKGLGILLVVWSHACGPFSSYIYQFHMPLFFLISGYLYSTKSNLKDFVIRKFKSLYIPFVFWNLLFYGAFQLPKIKTTGIMPFGKEAVKIILTLSKDGTFLGATWFLGALFVICILYKLIDCVIPDFRFKDYLMLGIFAVIAVVAFRVTFNYKLSRTLILGLFYAFGVFVKKHEDWFSKIDHWPTAVICAAAFIVIGHFNSANMSFNKYTSCILFVIGACMASYAVIYLSRLFAEVTVKAAAIIKSVFIMLGKQSLDILIWQFVFFRPVIMIQMLINKEPLTYSGVMSYYPVYSASNGWWIVYIISGCVISLLWCKLLRAGCWGRFLGKIHIV